jgi:membrane protease YdiL (CAAX protease family)
MFVADSAPASRLDPVAPWRHSLTLIAVFVTLALAGALFQQKSSGAPPLQPHASVLPLYASLLIAEWGLFLFVWKRGLQHTGARLSDLIGGRWASPRDVLVDLTIAVAMYGAWTLVIEGWDRLTGPAHAASIAGYLPRGPFESALWVLVSLSAGFCEELVFRGYFQRQFSAWTHSRWVGLALQAALFGISHGYQGAADCAKIACFGVLYGLVAVWLGRLRPGMIAHAMTDIMSGIFRV